MSGCEGDEECRTNLVHADPCVALEAVGHDAIVTGKAKHVTTRKAVAIDCSNDGDWWP